MGRDVVRHPGSLGVSRRPDRSIGGMRRQGPVDRFDEAVGEDARIQPESFTQDPGMRARDEFADITSRGYNEWAKRAAEHGGSKEYATSVEEEEAAESAATKRDLLMIALLTLLGGKGLGHGIRRLSTSPRLRMGAALGPVGPQQFAKYSPPALDHATGNAMAAIMGAAAGIGRTGGQSRRAEAEPERRGWLDEVQRMRRG